MARLIEIIDARSKEKILINISLIESVYINNNIKDANSEIKLINSVSGHNSFFVVETLEEIKSMCNS